MKTSSKKLAAAIFGMLLAGIVQAGDMGDAVTYSLGEFDRVGVNRTVPKTQEGKTAATSRKPASPQTAQERELAVRKAEFVRRMFWLALSAR